MPPGCISRYRTDAYNAQPSESRAEIIRSEQKPEIDHRRRASEDDVITPRRVDDQAQLFLADVRPDGAIGFHEFNVRTEPGKPGKDDISRDIRTGKKNTQSLQA